MFFFCSKYSISSDNRFFHVFYYFYVYYCFDSSYHFTSQTDNQYREPKFIHIMNVCYAEPKHVNTKPIMLEQCAFSGFQMMSQNM